MLQGELKHLSGAPQKSDTNAVQHHALTALQHGWRQMPWLYALNEPAKTVGNRFLRGRPLCH